jgi:hypothetical protein
MIKSGGSFFFKGNRCVIGAVISIKGLRYIVAASHIFHGAGDTVKVDGMEVVVKSILKDFDLALIELPPDCMVEFTEFGSAALLEDALLSNEQHSIACRVVSTGASLIYLRFPCFDMPQPGDSGSPILQAGKVVGLISSVMLSNCMGTAVSSDVLRILAR